jgi:hypothetical protein
MILSSTPASAFFSLVCRSCSRVSKQLSTNRVRSRLGLRISDSGSKKPLNVGISAHYILTFDGSSSLAANDMDDGEHDRFLKEDANDSRQRHPRLKVEPAPIGPEGLTTHRSTAKAQSLLHLPSAFRPILSSIGSSPSWNVIL